MTTKQDNKQTKHDNQKHGNNNNMTTKHGNKQKDDNKT